ATAGNVRIESKSNNSAESDSQGDSAGIIGVGIQRADVEISTDNQIGIAGGAGIASVSGDVIVLADSFEQVDTSVESGSGGIVAVSEAKSDVNVDHETLITVAGNATITAGGSVAIRSTYAADMDANARAVSVAGFAVPTARGTIQTEGQNTDEALVKVNLAGGTLTAPVIDVIAEVSSLDLYTDVDSRGSGLVSDADSFARTDVSANTEVVVDATLNAEDEVNFIARQSELDLVADAFSTSKANGTNSAGGSPNATARALVDTASNVTTTANSQITVKDLNVRALTDPNMALDARANNEGAGSALIDPVESTTVQADRIIDFNSKVILPVADDPILILDSDGNVLEREAITFSSTDALITIDDLINTGTQGGTVTLEVNTSNRDSEMTDPRQITGSPDVTFQTGYLNVTIENQSDKPIEIQNMDVVNESATASDLITILGSPNVNDLSPTANTDTGATNLVIQSVGGIRIGGRIDNPFGSTTITSDGAIVTAEVGVVDNAEISNLDSGVLSNAAQAGLAFDFVNPVVEVVESGARWRVQDNEFAIDLALDDGVIRVYETPEGSSPNAIRSDQLRLEAGGILGRENYAVSLFPGTNGETVVSGFGQNVHLEMLGGDLNVNNISSANLVRLVADGSILDNDLVDLASSDISAPTIQLVTTPNTDPSPSAEDHVIGSRFNALEINAVVGFSAIAGGNITLVETLGTMNPQAVLSRFGDIRLSVFEQGDAFGQDLIVGEDSIILAASGSVTLEAGDDIDHFGAISGKQTVNFLADVGSGDVGKGATVNLLGFLGAGSGVMVTTGDDADTINFRRLDSIVQVDISTAGGADTINVGSDADSALSLLSPLTSILTIDAGEEADSAAAESAS
ncbi:MAG: hypothetical protein AAFX06_33710, partial [Planctomycetota bacterium]